MKSESIRSQNWFVCALELIIGILLLINPVGLTRTVIVILGITFVLQGIVSIRAYFQEPKGVSGSGRLAKGLALTCCGLFCVFRSSWFIAAFPILSMFYGVFILVTAFDKIQWAADARRNGVNRWYVSLISAILATALAILVFANPFASTAAMWTFIGIALIVEAVVDAAAIVTATR